MPFEATNVLAGPLRTGAFRIASSLKFSGGVRESLVVQRFQAAQEKRIIRALEYGRPFSMPLLLRVLIARARHSEHPGPSHGIWGAASAPASSQEMHFHEKNRAHTLDLALPVICGQSSAGPSLLQPWRAPGKPRSDVRFRDGKVAAVPKSATSHFPQQSSSFPHQHF